MGPLIGQFESKQKNEPSSFLPANAESVRALELSDQFTSAEGVAAIAVFSREGGLTPTDRAAIADVQEELPRRRPRGSSSVEPAAVLEGRRGSARRRSDRRGRRRGGADRRRRLDPGDGVGRRAGRPGGEGHRAGRLLGRREHGVRGHQLDAPLHHRSARVRTPRHHLPQPDLLDLPAARRLLRRGPRARHRVAPRRCRRRRQRPDGRHPPRARLRRGNRLRAPPHSAVPRGAPSPRGQARGHADRGSAGRPRESWLRPAPSSRRCCASRSRPSTRSPGSARSARWASQSPRRRC